MGDAHLRLAEQPGLRRASPCGHLNGPLSIGYLAYAAAKRGLGTFLYILGVLNINLGVMNLLPIPVLDGGHLLFAAIEKVRGRARQRKVRAVASYVGLALLHRAAAARVLERHPPVSSACDAPRQGFGIEGGTTMSEKVQVHYDSLLKETLEAMTSMGLLLVAQGKSGKPNAMAIGWGLIGSVWSRPVFTVLVRPSRYTYQLLEENGDFTVNVLPQKMKAAVDLCGTVSGRTHDKFAEAKLTAAPGLHGEDADHRREPHRLRVPDDHDQRRSRRTASTAQSAAPPTPPAIFTGSTSARSSASSPTERPRTGAELAAKRRKKRKDGRGLLCSCSCASSRLLRVLERRKPCMRSGSRRRCFGSSRAAPVSAATAPSAPPG